METTQTTKPTTNQPTAPNLAEMIKYWQSDKYKELHAQSLAPLPKAPQKTRAERQEETRNRLAELTEKRNALLCALNVSETVRKDFTATAHTLCETVAQISVYKTLLKLSDSAKDITQSGADMCDEMLRTFNADMRLYHANNSVDNYSDAMDLFIVAYMELWQYLSTSAPLTLADTVHTKVLKNGTEKNYTLFQCACKSIRDYIHSWSDKNDLKKMHYLVGYTDEGKQITTSKRPQTDVQSITAKERKAIFNKYGLTAQQQEIMHLLANREKPDTIATLLNIPLRTIQDNIKKAKAKFTTANTYAEYITAKNAEKLAKAKAEKYPTDSTYSTIYTKAQERTATALQEWKKAFKEESKRNRNR